MTAPAFDVLAFDFRAPDAAARVKTQLAVGLTARPAKPANPPGGEGREVPPAGLAGLAALAVSTAATCISAPALVAASPQALQEERADRLAIAAEPDPPPRGSPERARLERQHAAMVAGLMAAARRRGER